MEFASIKHEELNLKMAFTVELIISETTEIFIFDKYQIDAWIYKEACLL